MIFEKFCLPSTLSGEDKLLILSDTQAELDKLFRGELVGPVEHLLELPFL
jgi:hypothetical protein